MCLQIPEDRRKISLLESSTQLKPHKAQNYRKKALWVSWFSIIITLALVVAAFKRWKLEAEEDCGGVRQGDHQLTHKYVKNSSRYGTTPTKQPLGDSRRPQDSRGDRLSSLKWGRREDWDIKREKMENFWAGACARREGVLKRELPCTGKFLRSRA